MSFLSLFIQFMVAGQTGALGMHAAPLVVKVLNIADVVVTTQYQRMEEILVWVNIRSQSPVATLWNVQVCL